MIFSIWAQGLEYPSEGSTSSTQVGDVKVAAQELFGQRFLKLSAPDGRLLDLTESLSSAELGDGDWISAVAQQPKMAAAHGAFALWCVGGGRIVTWGDGAYGGDIAAVRDRLKKVEEVHASAGAFAAILADGTVVTWGDPDCGGDSAEVQEQLRHVQQVRATNRAFAAILRGGTVVSWGDPNLGGDCSASSKFKAPAELLQLFWRMDVS